MAGGHYTALSGMRARLDALDRLAADIANSGTVGYKAERAATTEAKRAAFGTELQSAIDVAGGRARLDLRGGSLQPTGRNLDLAIEGSGFLVVDTPSGIRFTRNGHLSRRADGLLATADGDAVQGATGPIKVGTGVIEVDADGTVRHDGAVAGKLKIVAFGRDANLVRETALRVRNDGPEPQVVGQPSIKSGSLEQSNVSIVERLAELSSVSRSFEALQRALSVLMNDVDTRAIAELGRR